MLAYYIMWHMRQRLKPLEDIDGVGGGRRYSFAYVMESLKSIRKNNIKFMDAETTIITTPSDEQSHILNLLCVAM